MEPRFFADLFGALHCQSFLQNASHFNYVTYPSRKFSFLRQLLKRNVCCLLIPLLKMQNAGFSL